MSTNKSLTEDPIKSGRKSVDSSATDFCPNTSLKSEPLDVYASQENQNVALLNVKNENNLGLECENQAYYKVINEAAREDDCVDFENAANTSFIVKEEEQVYKPLDPPSKQTSTEHFMESNTSTHFSNESDSDKNADFKKESVEIMEDSSSQVALQTHSARSRYKKRDKKRPPLPACTATCKLKCYQKIPENIRISINNKFWDLKSWLDRKSFYLSNVKVTDVKRRTSTNFSRTMNLQYSFTSDESVRIRVCKHFFLCTLGFNKTNDGALFRAFNNKSSITSEPAPANKFRARNRDHMGAREKAVQAHIESYNPYVPTYRHARTSNRRYLNSDLTIKEIWDDFLVKNPNYRGHCSYEVYRKIVKDMNIYFSKVGNEHCEVCEAFEHHNSQHTKNNFDLSCKYCDLWSKHLKNADDARKLYEKQNETTINDPDIACYSGDLQIGIMLPSMPSFKTVSYTKRMVAFNESFVPLKSTKGGNKPFSVLWSEAIASQRNEDITSAFYHFLIHCRDKKHVIIWLDGGPEQNKNWTLFAFFIYIINSNEINAEKIDVIYLETGHASMSANNFHHQIEEAMRKAKNSYDFIDLENAVRDASSQVIIKSMNFSDFSDWKNHASEAKLKSIRDRVDLDDVKQIQICRGDMMIKYKVTYEKSEEFKILDFLKVNILKAGIPAPLAKCANRGILKTKKEDIIQKLIPLMPMNRRGYWINLPASDAPDLIVSYDE